MATSYAGKYRLSEILDAQANSKELPAKDFEAVIKEDDEFLRFSVKIGNVMRTKIALIGESIEESQKVKVSGVLSTMMMPAPDLFEVEKFLSKTLPTVTTMKLEGDKLTLSGDGAAVLTKLD